MNKVLLGITGSVAATLTDKLVTALRLAGLEVQIVATASALYFWDYRLSPVPVWLDAHEWPGKTYHKNDEVKHIALRDWADILLIAPLTANTLAKMANGFCDNLLTSIIRAWDTGKPIVTAPAMNTKMWQHPLTAIQLAQLAEWYDFTIVPPASKLLACGDIGEGALADINDIVRAVTSIKKGD